MGFLITNNMEVWKGIKGFEDYQVSNYGRVKSFKYNREKILKQAINGRGYFHVNLLKNKKQNTKRVHQLVAIAFLNHVPCGMDLVVNHKDLNKVNNNIDNLEIITNRQNSNHKHLKSVSQYIGVCWHKHREKWVSQISINNKRFHLGYFINEIDAHNAYQNKLLQLI